MYSDADINAISLMANRKKNADFEGLASLMIISSNVYDVSFMRFFDELPNHLKYKVAIESYTCKGDYVPIVRKKVRQALKWGKATLPEELKEKDTIEVFRAGEEEIQKARYKISWTTDIEVAKWFYNRHKLVGRAAHIYKGTIPREKIIAYSDDRKEKEIMQYMNVKNIVDITEEVAK